MNETVCRPALELLRTRRSVAPAFLKGEGPGAEELAQLLTLATRVPDHGKLAPWRFILFQGAARDRAGKIIESVFLQDNPAAPEDRKALERQRLAHAPLVIAIVSRAAPHVKIPEWEQVLSAGALAMNLTIAAKAAGYSTAWLTEWYAYDRRVLEQFGLSAPEKIAGFLHIGHAARVPEDRVRPVLAELITHF